MRRQDRGSGQFRFKKALLTDNPSLRAHSSNPAGGRLQSKPAGEVIVSCQIPAFRAEPRPEAKNLDASGLCRLCRATQPLNSENQFTKRRIRTFITTPSARNVNNTEDPP